MFHVADTVVRDGKINFMLNENFSVWIDFVFLI
jgi:hypothetical protein